WLDDLRADQFADGAMPLVVPSCLWAGGDFRFVSAAWGDAATVVPWTLYQRCGDVALLERQFESMRGWVDFMRATAGDALLWPENWFQLGDWLDPDAPPDNPAQAKTSPTLVSSAYFAYSAQIVSDAAAVLGHADAADEHAELAREVRQAFRDEYVTP